MPDDYDSPWKEAIERYFSDFMHFYFPAAHARIDWSQPYLFLDQELRAVVHDGELGKRVVDKLARVSSHSGQSEWVYVHIEVQGEQQDTFALLSHQRALAARERLRVAVAPDRVGDRAQGGHDGGDEALLGYVVRSENTPPGSRRVHFPSSPARGGLRPSFIHMMKLAQRAGGRGVTALAEPLAPPR